jgi:transposase
MSAQPVQLFPVDNSNNAWRNEVFEFLNKKLDQIVEQTDMKKIEDITGAIFQNRSEILGQLTLGLIKKNYSELLNQEYCDCPICGKRLKAWNKKVKRTIESLGGSLDLYRPYFYCKNCHGGFYPLDEALGLAPSSKQYDIQDIEAWLSTELPFEISSEAFKRCTGETLSSDHMFETTNKIANHFDILDICPTKDEIEQKVNELSDGKIRRPIMMIAIDGAHAPTRPEPSPWKGKRGKGEWKEVKGFRTYLIDTDRIIHLISWHQVQNDKELAEALLTIKDAGLIPENKVRLGAIGDGASWIWNRIREIFPDIKEILDFYHCSEYIHDLADIQYSKGTRKAQEWVEAAFARLFHNDVTDVIRGIKRMKPTSSEAKKKIKKVVEYLSNHREKVDYGAAKRGGYHIGSGAIESANKFIAHVRLKRSGAWWYITNANNILKLRCAKYNGTYDRIIQNYKKMDREKTYTKFSLVNSS